jgi:leader peptidase (prepilin peptidase)/N-methyltransferase
MLIVLGLCLGSFVNALTWRLREQSKTKSKKQRKRLSVLSGRSMCPNCHHKLAAKDLIPVASWLTLKGKCHYCSKPISAQYPLVELATAGLFVFSYYFWPLNLHDVGLFEFVIWLGFLIGFMALVIFDLRWFLLPDKIIYPLIVLALLQLVAVSIWDKDSGLLLGALWGVLMLGGLFYILFQVSNGRWIGGGDVKLGALLGIIVGGPLNSILLLLMASLSGTVIALPLIIRGKAKANSKVPFGPFLILAVIITQLFDTAIVHWYKRLYL